MHLSFLEYLVCPRTGEPLRLIDVQDRIGDVIWSGHLGSSGHVYPIVRGIPRFLGGDHGNYADSFGYQWNKWPKLQFESENVGGPMEGHTTNMFERIIGESCKNLRNSIVLDVGCGPGRFVDVVRRQNGKVVGIDYSDAVEAARSNFPLDENVLICQADAMALPIRPGSMDGAYSIGVLHHTPDPALGLRQMTCSVREGGWVAVSVYGKGEYYDSTPVRAWRNLFKILSPVMGTLPPLIYSYVGAHFVYHMSRIPIFGRIIRTVYPTVLLPDHRWRLLDTFDSVTPTYQSSHSFYEVHSWFKDAGLSSIEPADWGGTSVHGIRVPAASSSSSMSAGL